MVIYRPNRGGLAEAMENAKEFESFDEMKRHVVEEHEETWGRKAFEFDDIVIEAAHGEDRRIGWKDCRYVCVKRYLWDEYKIPMCIGQCATDYPGLEQSKEMCRKFLNRQNLTDKEKIETLESKIREMESFWENTVSTRVTKNAQKAFDNGTWGLLKICSVNERESQRWIKVTPETMPPGNTPVMITVRENERKKVLIGAYWDDGERCWAYQNFLLKGPLALNVTHWMPLPPPAED